MIRAPDPEGAVPCVDELDRGVHDGAQCLVQFEPGCDGEHRLDQTVEPVTALDDLFDTVLNFTEKFTQS
ncbi:hypothetical protein MTY66_28230 [Mycolicibacterium sp. TY66]|nr:hypothetical protein MTY66_28230 [Mycolicibacterium sp. TY66]BCJ81144.1 hypothetical protein MTY81_25170 [Mycolicibacterium sp. TY81]